MANTVLLGNPGQGKDDDGGQNARATGGPGILPGISNSKACAKQTVLGGTPALLDAS